MRPGGAGAPPAGTMTRRQELADGVGATPSQKRGPDAVKRHRVERRGAQRPSPKDARTCQGAELMWRLAALHSLSLLPGAEEGMPASPRRKEQGR